jgi:hypothetical protein
MLFREIIAVILRNVWNVYGKYILWGICRTSSINAVQHITPVLLKGYMFLIETVLRSRVYSLLPIRYNLVITSNNSIAQQVSMHWMQANGSLYFPV